MTVKEYNRAVDDYADGLYRFVLKNCRQEELARDVVQESFEKLWLKLEDISGSKVKTYLFTTGYHTMIDQLRKEKRIAGWEQVQEADHTHEQQYSDLNEILEKALQQLPESQRTAILLRDYEGYSYTEIANITELSESQVKVYIYRARVKMKQLLVKMENVV